jgi:hypothetical protein
MESMNQIDAIRAAAAPIIRLIKAADANGITADDSIVLASESDVEGMANVTLGDLRAMVKAING